MCVCLNLNCFQVSYCENEVDCRRLLQLVHFGEKFNSINCKETCDNCLKVQNFIEKDVTHMAKQLVRKHIQNSLLFSARYRQFSCSIKTGLVWDVIFFS